MSDRFTAVTHVWPWLATATAIGGALWRWWRSRTDPPRREPYDAEEVLFPRTASLPPGRGIARWLSSPLRLELKEAGEQAMAEEVAGLREDLRRAQADLRRLRAELDGRGDSSAGSTATGTAKNPPSRRPRPRSQA